MRSVSVCDAGLRVLERLQPAISEMAGGLKNLNQKNQRPLGTAADLCEKVFCLRRSQADACGANCAD